MANTTSAQKATRKIARRTEVNKARRSQQMRSFGAQGRGGDRAGDRAKALAALKEAEPVIMRSAQKGIVHRNAASRKVSRLSHSGSPSSANSFGRPPIFISVRRSICAADGG